MNNRTIKFRARVYSKESDSYSMMPHSEMVMLGINPATIQKIDGKEVELMQFTGILDKNGKEIYEGDVVQFSTNYYGKLRTDRKQEVKWLDDIEHDGFGQPLGVGFILYGYDWEVIGNIYENPELLTP